MYYYVLEPKQETSQWQTASSSLPRKVKMSCNVVIMTIYFDCYGFPRNMATFKVKQSDRQFIEDSMLRH